MEPTSHYGNSEIPDDMVYETKPCYKGDIGYLGDDWRYCTGIHSLSEVHVESEVKHETGSSCNVNFYTDVDISGVDGFFRGVRENNNSSYGWDELDYIYLNAYDYNDSDENWVSKSRPIISGATQRILSRLFKKKRFDTSPDSTIRSFSSDNFQIRLHSIKCSKIIIDRFNRANVVTLNGIKSKSEPSSETAIETEPKIEAKSDESNEEGNSREECYLKLFLEMAKDMEGLGIEQQLETFWKLFPLTISQRNGRIGIAKDVKKLLRKWFTDCEVHLVGNDVVGIATDLDQLVLCIDPFGKFSEVSEVDDDEEIHPSSQARLIQGIFKILHTQKDHLQFCKDLELKTCSWVFSNDGLVEKISFVHLKTQTKCVLILEHFIILQQSRLLKFLASLDLRVQPLMCFVRCFSSVFGFFETSSSKTKEPFPDHTMLWILVFFLTSIKILPSVLHLQNLSNSSLILENTDVSFCSIRENIIGFKVNPAAIEDSSIRALSLVSILQEFFEFFGDADLSRNVICPAIGAFIPVQEFGIELGEEFPLEMITKYLFTDGPRRRRRTVGFNAGCPMGLQDPFFLTKNLTRDVTLDGLIRFQDCCKHAASKLAGILEGNGGLLTDIFTNLVSPEWKVGLKRKWNEESEDEEEADGYKLQT